MNPKYLFPAALFVCSVQVFAASGTMSRDAFKKAVMGKTQAQVMKAVGSPSSTVEVSTEDGKCEIWNYRGATYHPVTKRQDVLVSVMFSLSTNRAIQVDF